MTQLTSAISNDFKIQTVILAYWSAALKTDSYPTMLCIFDEIPTHFWQEFALDVQMHDRFESYGADGAEEFIERLKQGEFDKYTPDITEVTHILDIIQFPFFDRFGNVHNCVLQEVW